MNKIPDGRTHYEGCWQERTHHDCALEHIARVEAERDRLHADLIIATDDRCTLRAGLTRMQGPVTPHELSRACNYDISGKTFAIDGCTVVNALLAARADGEV